MRSKKFSIAVVAFVALFMIGWVNVMSAQQLPGKDRLLDARFRAHIQDVILHNPQVENFYQMGPGTEYKLPDGTVDKLEKGDAHGIWGREFKKKEWYGYDYDPATVRTAAPGNANTRFEDSYARAIAAPTNTVPEKHGPWFWVSLWLGIAAAVIGILWLFGKILMDEQKQTDEAEEELLQTKEDLREAQARLNEQINGPTLRPSPFFVRQPLPEGLEDPTLIGERFAYLGVREEQAEVAARQSLREFYAASNNNLRPDYSRTTVENMRHVLFSGNGEVHARDITPREMQLLREPGWTFDGTVIGPDGKVSRFEGVGTLQGCANPFRYRAEHLTGFEIEEYNPRLAHVPFDVVPFGATPGAVVRSETVLVESESPIRIRLGEEVIELPPSAILRIESKYGRFLHDPIATGQGILHNNITLLPVVPEPDSLEDAEVVSSDASDSSD